MGDDDEDVLPGLDAAISYSALPGATWRDVPFDEGAARYDIDAMTDGGIDFMDLTGGDPLRFAVHDGDLHIRGPLYVRNAEPNTVYIVEGTLTIDGPLVLADAGRYVPLWIRGDLVVPRLAVLLDTHLFVEGNLRVAGELVTYLKDAAHVIALESAAVGSWLRFYSRGAIFLESVEAVTLDESDERLAPEVAAIPNKPLAIGEQVFADRSVLR
jgi:hypothetical protein